MSTAYGMRITWRCISTVKVLQNAEPFTGPENAPLAETDWCKNKGWAMPELFKTSLRCHQKLPYLLSPLAEAVHWGAWGLRVHQPGRPHHCSPRHCASSHSLAAPGGTYWLGWCYCCAAPEVCGAQTASPSCFQCLQKCCAHHRQIQSQIQDLSLDLWN